MWKVFGRRGYKTGGSPEKRCLKDEFAVIKGLAKVRQRQGHTEREKCALLCMHTGEGKQA